MSEWHISPFAAADRADWDRLVAESGNGTFLHTRRFLDYHRERFVDRSLVIRDRSGRVRGVFPAAESPGFPGLIVSHPGATFGGLLTDAHVTGGPYVDMMKRSLAHWSSLGYKRLRYRAVPWIFHAPPRQEDLYCLWSLGGKLTVRQLSACVDLRKSVKRRIRSHARSETCTLSFGSQHLREIWPVIEETLRARHGVSPVHSLDEIIDLARRFPGEIETMAALSDGRVVGGAILFCSATVVHLQYCMSSPEGMAVYSGNILVAGAIERARERGARFFDFGISTDRTGGELNEGLHTFKMRFGAGTLVYEQYDIDI